MGFLDILQRFALETIGLLLIVVPGIMLLLNALKGQLTDWQVYVVLIAIGGLMSGFKAFWNNIMRLIGK